ncbi:hypothetical protein [Noviherbaspirillum sp.]|uniref:hypothetical protein n=1 Tax=Noviherbaspirillum sp. TaxID=1926288 RepID=UPI002FE32103
MKPTLIVHDLPNNAELDTRSMSAIIGGFFPLLFACNYKSYDERVGESECNNGICVPYQDESGNY